MGKTPDHPRNAKAGSSKVEEQRDGQDKVSFGTDGSRLESGMAGAGVASRYLQTWKTQKVRMRSNKKVFNAEHYAVAESLEVASRGEQTTRGRLPQDAAPAWTKVHIWMDSQATIAHLKHMALG